MNEIITTIADLLQFEFKLKVNSRQRRWPSCIGDIALVADSIIQSTGFYQQKIHVLSEMNKTIACSIEKAQEELGYAPNVALEEGMRRSLKWCIQTGNLT